jgi:hypothetical protein
VKKALLFAVIAFVLSLAGTTATMVKLAPHPGAAAKPDSPAAEPREADADSTRPAAADTSPKTPVPEEYQPQGDSIAAPLAKPAAAGDTRPAPHPTPGPARDPEAKAAAVKQVARVLSAMKPVEAAKVLAFLSDGEVEGILRAVGPRQAADFMTNLPKERAANLSRRLMAPREPTR